MAITMQGAWALRVKARNAAYAQRFVVSGAETGNGIHDGMEGERVHVSGPHWVLQVQHRHTQMGWRDSSLRFGLPSVEDGVLQVDITSNDGEFGLDLDLDRDHLVLGCSLPVSQSEHVVYGSVASHDGRLLFNPRRDDYLVLDAPVDVAAVCDQHPALRSVLDTLYPNHTPGPHAGGPELSPMIVPNGLPGVAVGLLFESRAVDLVAFGDDQAAAVQALQASVGRVPFQAFSMKAGADSLSRAELLAIAQIRDRAIRQTCEATPVGGLTLRFQRYHRSRAEMAGEAYRGTGLREELGQAMTDEQGQYLFRFRQPWGGARPDLIVQVAGAAKRPCFESAPYDRVANLRRIDLCVPERVCTVRAGAALAARAVVFEYVGHSSLTVVGPASGRCYQFSRTGASLVVDERDRETLNGIRSLRVKSA
jgi:hypothetical protein